ncbi:MAG: helix-turn-helix domain-containing protein [Elusimicrobiota bacterium]|nr:helix-turn-helix domain-containing protein [Elusimicrobiota bacterium]
MTTRTEDGSAILARVRRAMGPEMAEVLLSWGKAGPVECRQWPPAMMFQHLRCRLRFSQAELARKAGLTQSQVSRIESGADCLLSTWARAYAALGFELKLLPSSHESIEELERRAEEGRPRDHWARERAKPRRHLLDGRMVSRAEFDAARNG